MGHVWSHRSGNSLCGVDPGSAFLQLRGLPSAAFLHDPVSVRFQTKSARLASD